MYLPDTYWSVPDQTYAEGTPFDAYPSPLYSSNIVSVPPAVHSFHFAANGAQSINASRHPLVQASCPGVTSSSWMRNGPRPRGSWMETWLRGSPCPSCLSQCGGPLYSRSDTIAINHHGTGYSSV